MGNKKNQYFGGPWTKEKLEIFQGYLKAYLTALKKQSFRTVYIDAFAGTGIINISNDEGRETIEGSAKRALSSALKFDHYYFIEYSKKKCKELCNTIHIEFPEMEESVTVVCGDANEELSRLIDILNWKSVRALLFIDPFATAFKWKTLEKVASTQAIDLWYLFPYYALSRMLTRNGEMDSSWEFRIDELLGTNQWRESFYMKTPEVSLFDDEEETVKVASLNRISEFLIARLKSVFPAVAKKPYLCKNRFGTPLFLFCFAVSNPNKIAQGIALRIANYIIHSKDGI